MLALAPVCSLVLLEVGFRLHARYDNWETIDSLTVPPPVSARGHTRLVDIIQPVANDDIIYELRPNLRTEFKERSLTTNSFGFRGPEVTVEAEPGTITIVGIGASIMFGHGVGDEEIFPVMLERHLNRMHPERRWRFINISAPSYNVVMKVASLHAKGLQFRPDLVILGIAGNNLDLPVYIKLPRDPRATDRSFLVEFFASLRRRQMATRERDAVLARVDKEQLPWGAYVENDPARIPPAHRHLVGWPPFYRAMDDLAATSRAHGFEVVVLAHLDVDITSKMLRESEQRGFHPVSSMQDLVEWMERNHPETGFTLEAYSRSQLVVSPSNAHPSVFQHRLIAQRLYSEMVERGILERLLARPQR